MTNPPDNRTENADDTRDDSESITDLEFPDAGDEVRGGVPKIIGRSSVGDQ